jgi:hypothetical protein
MGFIYKLTIIFFYTVILMIFQYYSGCLFTLISPLEVRFNLDFFIRKMKLVIKD